MPNYYYARGDSHQNNFSLDTFKISVVKKESPQRIRREEFKFIDKNITIHNNFIYIRPLKKDSQFARKRVGEAYYSRELFHGEFETGQEKWKGNVIRKVGLSPGRLANSIIDPARTMFPTEFGATQKTLPFSIFVCVMSTKCKNLNYQTTGSAQ